MTKRDLFILIIRIFGLYWMIQTVLFLLPNQVFVLLQMKDPKVIVWVVGSVVLILGLLIVLMLFSGKLVDALKLGKGFDDERIELGNLKPFDFYRIGLFFLGGLFALRQLTVLLHGIMTFFKNDQAGIANTSADNLQLLSSGLTFFVGFLILSNSATLAKWFANKEQTNNKLT